MKVIIQKKFILDERIEYPILIPYKRECKYLLHLLGEQLYTALGNIPNENIEKNDLISPNLIYINLQNRLIPIIFCNLPQDFSIKKSIILGKKVTDILNKFHYDKFYYIPLEDVLETKDDHYTRKFIEGLFYGLYSFSHYKKNEKEKKITELYVITEHIDVTAFFNKKFPETALLFKYLHCARDLINEPSNIINPESFAQFIKNNAEKNIDINIWDEKQIESEKLNLIAAVGKGSPNKPRFVIMHYKGDPTCEDHICLVGKGVTFDSGGTNLKPTGSIETMKSDMAGAAISYALINFIATLQHKINLTVLLPLVENIIGANSYKPGDIYISYSGKSVEIANTDAEGRLILADSLSYGVKNGAKAIIDIATLTGAIVVTFGSFCAGYFTNSELLNEFFLKSVDKTCEDFFRLPLIDDYRNRIKSKNADLQNVANQRREAGSIIAALFLEDFVEKIPWIHLDIAGPAFLEEEHPLYGSGGTAYGFRSLYEFITSIYGVINKK